MRKYYHYVKSTMTGQIFKIDFDVSHLLGYEEVTEADYLAYCHSRGFEPQ